MKYILMMLVIAFTLMSGAEAVATEKPAYVVIKTDDNFEIRNYPSMILAEVKVTGDRKQAANRGFRKLAAFIFGDNQPNAKIAMTSPVLQTPKREKIAMTAPVLQTPNQSGAWTINFMMPSEYTMETLPKPIDTDIRVFQTTPYQTVSIRFSGSGGKKSLSKHQAKLDAFISSNELKVSSGPEFAFYDAPFVPPMMRRNEIHYRLAAASN